MGVVRVQNRYLVSIYRHAPDDCEVVLSEYQTCHSLDEIAALLSAEPAQGGFLAFVECRSITIRNES